MYFYFDVMHQKKIIYKTISLLLICGIIISSLHITYMLNLKTKYEDNILSYVNNVKNIQDEINVTYSSNILVSKKVQNLQNNSKHILKDPTYEESCNFIYSDETNEEAYDYEKYNCAHFSKDVNNNAENENLSCAYVRVNLQSNIPHALIAFNTTDKGIVFFEPQTDEEVDLEIGKDYWSECVISKNPLHESDPGNTVLDFIIYW